MNYTLISRTINMLLLVMDFVMIPSLATALYYNETEVANGFIVTIGVVFICNIACLLAQKPTHHMLKSQEGFLVATLVWISASLVGAVPFLASGYTNSVIDAVCQATSCVTTTGASVLEMTNLPKSLLLWMATMDWIGGMGIIVFAVSFLPVMGISGQNLYYAETSIAKLSGRISDSAKTLFGVHIGFTLMEFVLLIYKMKPFEALITTLTTVSTAALFVAPEGITYYNSVYVETVICFFTLLATTNVTLFPYLLRGDLRNFFSPELKAFWGILVGISTLIFVNLLHANIYNSIGETLRFAFFQVVAIGTTTGYEIANYNTWPSFSRFLLFCLFFIGGCTSSASGSIKVGRFVIAVKLVFRNLYQRLHPHAVVAVKLGNKPISANVVSQTTSLIFLFITSFIFGTLVLSLQGLDLITTISTSISALSNMGLGFGSLNGGGDFSVWCPALKVFLSILMIVGRLEIFTVIILFTKEFWKQS